MAKHAAKSLSYLVIKTPAMKKKSSPRLSCIFILAFLVFNYAYAQTVQITSNPGQTTNIVVGPNFGHVSENIYTETEIGASNFTTVATSITHIDFNVFAISAAFSVDSFNVYLKEVPLTTTTFTTGVYDTAGYTLVFSGTYNITGTGWIGFDLTTPFIRTAGNNLQLMIERRDSVLHGASSFNATRGNNIDAALLTSRRTNIATKPVPGVTFLNTATAFRPQIQLRHINANDAGLTAVYSLGKLPVPFAAPHTISANVVNNGSGTLTNLNVNLDITGANVFSDVQTIASLAPGASAVVSFNAFTPVSTGFNTITVSLPADDFSGDNSSTVAQEVTTNAYTYSYGNVPSNVVGINGATGDFVAMFTNSSPTSVNQVGINFAQNGQPFRIGIWDKSGNSSPGTLLWESTDQFTTAGVFTLPINPPVAITDTFYIGVRQTTTTNVQFAYQLETPIRPRTFFFTTPSGNPAWTDFAPSNPFRFMIEPRLTLANDVGVASISNPLGASSIDNCGILPQAVISNFGSNDQTTPFDVTFHVKQAGTVVYSDTQQVTVNSGESKTVYFTPFNGSVSGIDSAFVTTRLAVDAALNNDTVVNRFTTAVYSYSDSAADSDGYSYANSTFCASLAPLRPTYNWINQTGNQINWGANGDDSVLATPLAIPFPFKFFGNTYNQLWVCSNGWISFSDPSALNTADIKTPVSIPAAGGLSNYIAGVLANLDNTSAVYSDAQTFYGNDASGFVITFHHAHLFGSVSDYITFQIILKVNGDILVQYNDAESTAPAVTPITNFCSVGIENEDGTKGILYRLNGSGGPVFGSPLALQFYTRPLSPVPVSLLRFFAEKGKLSNKLYWTTTQEINSKTFKIERSNNGVDFTSIGEIKASSNSNSTVNYSFTDHAVFQGANFYRLQMLNTDNSFRYSNTVSVTNELQQELTIYPSPSSGEINIWFKSEKISPAVIQIYDMNGKLVFNKKLLANKGINSTVASISALAAGNYTVKIKTGSKIMMEQINKF
jgi:Secretion system C-terminal sorting domain/CARDB